ncbi:aminoglycoside adenylyltransferase domain-containing protein [Virgibacillus doumboii]|uniref:aminoglycoside adenylyltransferase domain-containing protein n=1 Tax=Virgibacillus doumboii TaxID=2697503 RepID=UPI0013DF180D|nr:aminoglycoside adenylyltransferase domain-containing protein [Virgibacillus doumboii]
MTYNWKTCSSDIKDFVYHLLRETKEIIKKDFVGFYLHGSLAMGGLNPSRSDIDILVVTERSLTIETKKKLAQLFLTCSGNPFPVEISFLNEEQLTNWKHPSPFDFHFSEYWRERYEADLSNGTNKYINEKIRTDADLAAHITIINNRGVCIEGIPIVGVFPSVPQADYISSIMGDYRECLENIEGNPVYCTINLIRVYWYLKEGVISSKEEAGRWGLSSLPNELTLTVQKALNHCYSFEKVQLQLIKNYIDDKVQALLS